MGIGAILALVGPPLFQLAEQIFQGQKLGANRMGWVQAAAQQFIEFLVNGGKLPDGSSIPTGTRVPDSEMKSVLEALFQQSKKLGLVNATEAKASPGWLLIEANQMVSLGSVIK